MDKLEAKDKWVITDIETDEPILIYNGSFMEVMDFLNKNYDDEDGTVDVETYENWIGRQQKGKTMAKLTEEQKAYWRYLIDDNNLQGFSIKIEFEVESEVKVVKDITSEIEVEYMVVQQKQKGKTMNECFNCGYWWADLDEDGTPLSLEYCHYNGPDGCAPCEQDIYDEYANEAAIEEEAAREEAEFDVWLESVEESARPQNAHEYVEAWKQFRGRYEEEPTFEEYGAPYDYQEF